MSLRKIANLPRGQIAGKKVLMRVDFNVPVANGKVCDTTRIEQALPTVNFLLENGASIVLCTHLGRPKGKFQAELRLDPVAEKLQQLLGKKVEKVDDSWGAQVQSAKEHLQQGEILMLENLRFHIEETENDAAFAKQLAQHCDLFVSEAFGTVHREHASVVGVAKFLPAFAGFLVHREAAVLSKILHGAKSPFVLVCGGAKIDTKIGVLSNFLKIADHILIGGGLANTFLHAQGFEVGQSLCQREKASFARTLLQKAENERGEIVLPVDVAVARDDNFQKKENIPIAKLQNSDRIFDAGERTVANFCQILQSANTIVFNGPVGFFEKEIFANGTKAIANTIAENQKANKVVGGGDTIEAIDEFGIEKQCFSHISTGGGAMLKFLEGKMLPGLVVLQNESVSLTGD